MLALLKDYVSVIRLLKHHVVQKPNGGDRVLWGKVRNLCRVYKLIMISRVPGYGHLEYLVVGLSCESQHVTIKLSLTGLFNDV